MLADPASAHRSAADSAPSEAAPSDAGAANDVPFLPRRPRVLVFDSGLGGLTVFAEVAKLRPDADFTYAADDAGFPYGAWREPELVARIERVRPDLAVIACNTASTLVLPDLRRAFPAVPFVGTVPAIKPAAALSRSGLISVLATPGTVARDYTRGLVEAFAGDCRVTLVGSTALATLAEAAMAGGAVDDAAIAAEIAPCFVQQGREAGDRRTDCVVLACTHYPLLIDRFRALAPWPVSFIDPADAIARRVDGVLRERGFAAAAGGRREDRALFTSGRAASDALRATLAGYGLAARR